MTWTVHRLDAEIAIFDLGKEDVLLIIFIMAGALPQFYVVDLRRNNLFVPLPAVKTTHIRYELIIDYSALRMKKWATRGNGVETK